MAQPYVGEIRMFGGNFAPAGWALCDGQLLAIAQNETLFTLIGTTYGGDGQSTFALPDLRGRIPIHQGQGRILAETGGQETVTITMQAMPLHNHKVLASESPATLGDVAGNVVGNTGATTLLYRAAAPDVDMNVNATAVAGGSQPHDNLMPFQCVTFIIALFGIFPSPS